MREIVLDTETTGLDPESGHRVIEIAAVEVRNRRLTGNHFHRYLNPDRDIDEGALQVHGLTREFLADHPRFGDVCDAFLEFVRGCPLIIHNAPFDMGFLDHELKRLGREPLSAHCPEVVDTLRMAREYHPGQRNSLDALCKRYEVDNTHRTLHGALLDAELLADVYLAMTRGQDSLTIDLHAPNGNVRPADRPPIVPVTLTPEELAAHAAYLAEMEKASGVPCVWRRHEAGS